MKALLTYLFLILSISNLNNQPKKDPIIGKWLRITQLGPVAMTLKSDGIAEVDMGNDGTIEVTSSFQIKNDTIHFMDKEGLSCPEQGVYKLYPEDGYMAFDLISDECNGRIKMTMGFWTRPDFQDRIVELNKEIDSNDQTLSRLHRARIFMAVGNSRQAKTDLDIYLKHEPNDARALVNRAGTRFPNDLKGVIEDCNSALEFVPENKNAWFLRGLAKYTLGHQAEGCADFKRAIELGFTILKEAEFQRCKAYWEKE